MDMSVPGGCTGDLIGHFEPAGCCLPKLAGDLHGQGRGSQRKQQGHILWRHFA
jgi:hypothetical protein